METKEIKQIEEALGWGWKIRPVKPQAQVFKVELGGLALCIELPPGASIEKFLEELRYQVQCLSLIARGGYEEEELSQVEKVLRKLKKEEQRSRL